MPRGPMGRGHGPATEKAKDFKGTIKKLFAYLKPCLLYTSDAADE